MMFDDLWPLLLGLIVVLLMIWFVKSIRMSRSFFERENIRQTEFLERKRREAKMKESKWKSSKDSESESE